MQKPPTPTLVQPWPRSHSPHAPISATASALTRSRLSPPARADGGALAAGGVAEAAGAAGAAGAAARPAGRADEERVGAVVAVGALGLGEGVVGAAAARAAVGDHHAAALDRDHRRLQVDLAAGA